MVNTNTHTSKAYHLSKAESMGNFLLIEYEVTIDGHELNYKLYSSERKLDSKHFRLDLQVK